MSHRLPEGGRLIDRSRPVSFTFNGKSFEGFAGDTLAAAMLGADQMLMGRSFKYHRPRGAMAYGGEEPNALMNVGAAGFFEPNQRATTTALTSGMAVQSQNHWPSLNYDIGAVNGFLAKGLTAGFYYKTFIHPRVAWKHVFEPIIRQSAGLGRVPEGPDADTYEHTYAFADLAIVGGGIAGLQVALTAGAAGVRVILMEMGPVWGGRAVIDGVSLDGQPAEHWVSSAVARLEAMPNVRLRLNCMGAGVYDHGLLLGYEHVAAYVPGADVPRHRLWRIRAKQILSATGAFERPLTFAGNDIPGVMLASAMRDYLVNHGVVPGERVVITTNNDDGYRTALALHAAGVDVPCICDLRAFADGPMQATAREAGIVIRYGQAVVKVTGGKRVEKVTVAPSDGDGSGGQEIPCDAVAMSGGWSPAVHLFSHPGGKLWWDEDQAMFRPDINRMPTGADGGPFVRTAGLASGFLTSGEVLQDAQAAATDALAAVGGAAPMLPLPDTEAEPCVPIASQWVVPSKAPIKLKQKMWLDFQNDVKVSDVELAAREGYESVEHVKRYTTLGMATDQGKLSNINGLAILGGALDKAIPQVGTTTFRPPFTPISMGSIAGEARGDVFQPLRRTPMHGWHESKNVHWEPVGHWRRPYCYPLPGESIEQAVHREVRQTRDSLGILDASTLGKILVKGPDAGKFLDMLYTNMMSSLKPGRCRYGLMCTENGFLTDDGVVARIDEDTWLCHTTTGGADRIHAHMEDWLQTEWWDWQVYTANLTEQYAQIAVVGPRARDVLQRLGTDMDLSREGLPFMGWTEGTLAGLPARVFRISFSGELSFEVAVPSGCGLELWRGLMAAGRPFGVMPYGTEALHIMRAEKGFIMIGDETDGTVIPQDLGLSWAISKKKADYLGKRAQMRPHMTDPERWTLVGLEPLDGSVLPDGAYAVGDGQNAAGQRNVIGRVTSSYFSPTLHKGIGMGLVQRGPERMGEVLDFPGTDGQTHQARIVDPVFFDPKGEKQNV